MGEIHEESKVALELDLEDFDIGQSVLIEVDILILLHGRFFSGFNQFCVLLTVLAHVVEIPWAVLKETFLEVEQKDNGKNVENDHADFVYFYGVSAVAHDDER